MPTHGRRMGDVSNVGGGNNFIQTNGFHKHLIEVVCDMDILLKDVKKNIHVYGNEENEGQIGCYKKVPFLSKNHIDLKGLLLFNFLPKLYIMHPKECTMHTNG